MECLRVAGVLPTIPRKVSSDGFHNNGARQFQCARSQCKLVPCRRVITRSRLSKFALCVGEINTKHVHGTLSADTH